MSRTKWHIRCPGCGTDDSTEHSAVQLLRFEDSPDQVDSYNYAVCPSCHAIQYEAFYREENPITWTLSVIPRAEVP